MVANEVFGWTWILVGLLAGLGLGLGFHREEWLGGYASYSRRLLRLGHVSLVALGLLNVLFARLPALDVCLRWRALAAVALVVGAIAMPLCCALMAWRRSFRLLFGLPVASLLLGVGIVVAGLWRR